MILDLAVKESVFSTLVQPTQAHSGQSSQGLRETHTLAGVGWDELERGRVEHNRLPELYPGFGLGFTNFRRSYLRQPNPTNNHTAALN